MGPGAAAAAAAAAAASSSNLHRSFGSSDQLHSMEQLMQQQAAAGVGGHDDQGNAAGLGVLGNSMSSNNLAAVAAAAGLSANAAASLGLGNSMASASFDSGLNLMDQHHQAGGLGGLLGSYPYLSNAGDASAAGGLYRGAAGPGGRSLSHPCLSMSAMAAMAAQQQAQQQHQQQNAAAAAAAAAVAGRLFGQQNAAAAAALLQAQAQAAGLSNLQDFQQQQHQHMALQQLLQANLHAQQLAGAANLHAAQQALLQAGMHPQQLAAAGLLNPASLAGLGLPASSSYGTLHNLGALQLQSAAAAAASAAAAAAAGGSGIPRGASTGSLTGLGGMDGRGHRGGDGGAGSSGGSRGGGRLSRRAADPAVEAERKAQQERLFALDVDRIMSGEDKRTTLMIKNIPNKYTQKMLLQVRRVWLGAFSACACWCLHVPQVQFLMSAHMQQWIWIAWHLSVLLVSCCKCCVPRAFCDFRILGFVLLSSVQSSNHSGVYCCAAVLQTIEEQFKGTFDFFYLPIDFKNKCNVGYAFINMLKPQYIPPLVVRFNNKRWDKFNSEKVRRSSLQ
jgi:protein phosphatase 1 regulatory subunit 42